MRALPIGTSCAVWVGIGAVLTVVFAMVTGAESISVLKIVFLIMIIGGVVGLKASH
jgi:quaternary ammonium compound-resistance protein SugE